MSTEKRRSTAYRLRSMFYSAGFLRTVARRQPLASSERRLAEGREEPGLSGFLCTGRRKSPGSLKSFLWSAPQLPGASVLCSPVLLAGRWGTERGRNQVLLPSLPGSRMGSRVGSGIVPPAASGPRPPEPGSFPGALSLSLPVPSALREATSPCSCWSLCLFTPAGPSLRSCPCEESPPLSIFIWTLGWNPLPAGASTLSTSVWGPLCLALQLRCPWSRGLTYLSG